MLCPLELEAPSGEVQLGETGVKDENRGFRIRDDGWTQVKTVMDSGCSESVCPPTLAPDYPVTDSAGSLRGQHYIAASDHRIPNLGEHFFNIVTEDGLDSKLKYQVAEVSRPLNSVSDICDNGNRVLFGSSGGVIYNVESGRETYFTREEGNYILKFWIAPFENK